ncbi:DNA/RNA endonuclease G [Microbacterium panaciterrae]|uniref:DNA/RNA endonuclease G n=1 Tax=Microbacterium panaciterrae TaxID=985759 RepID=A0ABP8PJR9_9MICO
MTRTVLTRVLRREMHSPRTAAAVVVLVLTAAAAVYAGVEIVLQLVGAGPLLLTPGTALGRLIALPSTQPAAAVIAGGAVTAILGVLLIWLALSPGRRPRHQLGVSSHAVVVDNGVIASAVAERVRRELDLAKDAVVVGVSHRSADVTARPEPGQDLERQRVRAVAEAELARYETRPRLRVRARVLRAADAEPMR